MPRLLASCVLVLLCACGGSSDDTVFGTPGAGGAKPVVCVAGKQEACACPTGGVGAQRCKDDSSGYGVCEGCVGGAGASGGAGSGASAGAGGGNPGGAGGSSGKGGASAGGSGGSGGGNCMEPPAKVAATTTLLLADRSGSMNDSNKWGSSVSAWNGAVAAAPPTLRVGLLRFPENVMGADVCTDISPSPQVPFAPLSSSASAITKVLGMTIADGASPVLWALKNGYAALAAEPGPRFVVLVTDFAPLLRMMPPFPDNPLCGEYADFSDVVTAAAAASTKTFVIALPGSEAEGVTLSQMAIKGGTAKPGCSLTAKNCHTQISVSGLGAPLTAAVADALQTISRCVFEAPAGGAGSNLLTVKVGGQLQVLDSSHQGGWSFFDDSGTTVQLYGKACEDAKSGKAVTISNGACAL